MLTYETHLKKRFLVAALFFAKELSENHALDPKTIWHDNHPNESGVYWVKNDKNEFCRAFFFITAPHWGLTDEPSFIKDNPLKWTEYK